MCSIDRKFKLDRNRASERSSVIFRANEKERARERKGKRTATSWNTNDRACSRRRLHSDPAICASNLAIILRINRANPSIITEWNRKKLNKIIRNDSKRDELLGRDRKFGMEGIIPRDWNNCNGNCSNATKDYSFDYNLHPRTLRRQTNVAIKHSLSFEGSRIFQSEDKMKTRLNTKFHFFHSNSFHRGRTECTINTGTSLPVVRSENLA